MKRTLGFARWISLVTTLSTAMMIAGLGSGIAQAAAPQGRFLNPDAPDAGGDGPGNIISSKNDGTDSLYHFVVRLSDAEGLSDITGVEIQVEDGDTGTGTTAFETVGTATRVVRGAGATDTWELFWNVASQPATDVDNDAGFVRAAVFTTTEGGPNFVPSEAGEAVVFRNGADPNETAEITEPDNGDLIQAFNRDGDPNLEVPMRGTASSAIDASTEVELYYTTTAAANTDPDWIDCEEDTLTVTAGSPNTWSGNCQLATGQDPALVTAVAVRPDSSVTPQVDEKGNGSGDAHRVVGNVSSLEAESDVTVTRETGSTRTIGRCATFTATITDKNGDSIVGANIDVHAEGPSDSLQFSTNLNDTNDTDTVADAFTAPTGGAHNATEPTAGCDTAETTSDPGDDNDSENTGNNQAEHDTVSDDIKHIEGTTDADGFQFSVDSEAPGLTTVTAWFDGDDDDVFNDSQINGPDEAGGSQTVTWQNPNISISPTSDTQTVGFCNTYTVSVLDSAGQQVTGVNIDVHAEGPDDNIQFARNLDDTNDNDDVSDNTFTAPNSGHGTNEATAGCDTAGEPNDPADDSDTDASSNQEAVHARPTQNDPNPNDIKHIEYTVPSTDQNGFQFSIDSEAAGTTSIRAWLDVNDDDEFQSSSEPEANASKTWQAQVVTLNGTPERDTNPTGTSHTVTATVTDQNGNAIGSRTVHFRVMSGPHADNDLDSFQSTPNGYFGSCTTSASTGQCSQSYTGSEAGTDTIALFINQGGDTGDAIFTPENDDIRDDVSKTWFASVTGNVCIDTDPNSDINHVAAMHTITAFVTNGTFDTAGDNADAAGTVNNDCSGTPLNNVGVTFTITDDNPDARITEDVTDDENKETRFTNASGVATVTLDNKGDAEGSNVVTTDVEGTTSDAGDKDASKAWSAQLLIDCTPEDASNPIGRTHQVTCTVTDVGGNPMAGANVDLMVRSGPHADDDLDGNVNTPGGYIGEGTTNGLGQVSKTYQSGLKIVPNNGSDLIDGWIDANNDDVDNGDNLEADGGDADTTQEAEEQTDSGDVSDYVDKVWTGCPGYANDPRNHYVGTSGDDNLTGGADKDIMCGLDGNDTLNGAGNDDLLIGGNGNDTLLGSSGNDALYGQAGNDVLKGGTGRDKVNGGTGRDSCAGEKLYSCP